MGKPVLTRFHLSGHLGSIALVASVLWPNTSLAQTGIDLLLSEPRAYYEETAASLTQALRNEGWKITVSTPEANSSNGSDLTVAIGTKALETALARPHRPVLSVLVPRSTYERLAAGQRQVSALYLDQPLSRQLQLLGLAMPALRKVGVPFGTSSQALLHDLQTAAQESGIQVNTTFIRRASDLHVALTDLAKDSQAFLLLPDPAVAQRSTLQAFFLHTYRLRKPVLAYSAPLAKSGALLSLYATPAQLGEEAADWIRESWQKGEFRLGGPRYPRAFTISTNPTVAHSLDIVLPSVDVLTRRLRSMQ